jgi:hypothetical protein
METSLHSHDVNTSQLTEDERTGVAFYCRYGEIGNLAIREFELVSYL